MQNHKDNKIGFQMHSEVDTVKLTEEPSGAELGKRNEGMFCRFIDHFEAVVYL